MFPASHHLHNFSPTGYNNVPQQSQRSPLVQSSQTSTEQQQNCQPLQQSQHQHHQRQQNQSQRQQQNQQQYHQNHNQQRQQPQQQHQQNYLQYHQAVQPPNTNRPPQMFRRAIRIKTDHYTQPNQVQRSRLINVRGQMQGNSSRQQPLPVQQHSQLHQRQQYGTNQYSATQQQNQWQPQQPHRVLLKQTKVVIRPPPDNRVINMQNRYAPYSNRTNTPSPKKRRTLEEWGFTEADVAEFENGPWFQRTGCLICSRWFKNAESYLFHQNCTN